MILFGFVNSNFLLKYCTKLGSKLQRTNGKTKIAHKKSALGWTNASAIIPIKHRQSVWTFTENFWMLWVDVHTSLQDVFSLKDNIKTATTVGTRQKPATLGKTAWTVTIRIGKANCANAANAVSKLKVTFFFPITWSKAQTPTGYITATKTNQTTFSVSTSLRPVIAAVTAAKEWKRVG